MAFTGLRRNKWGQYFAILIGLLACPLVTSAASNHSSVPLRIVRGYLAVASVSINGSGPYDFLVDTGTNTTLIDPDLVAELKFKPIDRLALTTLTGSQPVPRYFLEQTSVGSASVVQTEALASPLDQLRRLDRNIRGILGMNFLENFSFRLDYEHHKLEIFDPSEPPEISGGLRVPIEMTESRLLVPVTSQASRDGVWKLALDSGISAVAIFDDRLAGALQNHNSEHCVGICNVAVHTNSFSSTVADQISADMRIVDKSLRNQPIVVLQDDAEIPRPPEDGLLPAALFHAVFFDRAQKCIVLNPR